MWKYTLDTELMYRKFWLLCSSVLLRVVGFQRINRRWEGNGYQIKHVKGTACLENCRWLVFLTCNECGGKWWKNMLGNPAHSHHSLPLCHASKENLTEVNCILPSTSKFPMSASLYVPYSSLFSHEVMSDFMQTHGLRHARLPCPSLSPGVCSNSCPLSWWCHPAISSSATPFSSCPQSFTASGALPMTCFFASCSQSTGALGSASVLPMNIQGYFPLFLIYTNLKLGQGAGGLKSNSKRNDHHSLYLTIAHLPYMILYVPQKCSHFRAFKTNETFISVTFILWMI